MTEKQIAKLVEMGAKRWTRGNKDRLYFSAWTLGLGYAPRTAKSNARCLMIDGEELTITKGNKLSAAKVYIDLTTDEIVCDYPEYFEAKVEAMIEETAEKPVEETAAEAAESETAEAVETETIAEAETETIAAPADPSVENIPTGCICKVAAEKCRDSMMQAMRDGTAKRLTPNGPRYKIHSMGEVFRYRADRHTGDQSYNGRVDGWDVFFVYFQPVGA